MTLAIWNDPEKRRWLAWGALVLVFLLVSIYRLSSAVLADRLMVAFDTTGAQLGTLHASFFYIYALMQLPAGVLTDRIGPRVTAAIGAVVLNLGAIGFSVSETFFGAFIGRALIGFGASVIFVAIIRFCASWYREDEFATMTGLTLAISGLGGVLATTPLAVTVATIGWRSTMGILGTLGLLTAIVVYLVAQDTPSSAGLRAVNGVPSQPTVSFRETLRNLRVIFRELETWLLCLVFFCKTGVVFTLIGLWGVPYIVQLYDQSVTAASYYTLLGSVGFVIGPPLVGWFSDRIGRRLELMVIGAIIGFVAVSIIPLTVTPPLWALAVIYFVVGFLMGTYGLGYPVMKERHDTRASGVSTATVNAAGFLGAAVFPTLMGLALDAYWTGETIAGVRVYTTTGYRVAFGIVSLGLLITLVCIVWLYAREHTTPIPTGQPT